MKQGAYLSSSKYLMVEGSCFYSCFRQDFYYFACFSKITNKKDKFFNELNPKACSKVIYFLNSL